MRQLDGWTQSLAGTNVSLFQTEMSVPQWIFGAVHLFVPLLVLELFELVSVFQLKQENYYFTYFTLPFQLYYNQFCQFVMNLF